MLNKCYMKNIMLYTLRCGETTCTKGYFLHFLVLKAYKGVYLCAIALQPFDCIL